MNEPAAADFKTVGEYTEALTKWLVAQHFAEINARLERLERLTLPPEEARRPA